MRIQWTPEATAELGAAVAWWLSSDARGFEEWIAALRRGLATVQRFPTSGRLLERATVAEARSIIVEPYRLEYVVRAVDDEIWISGCRHLHREPLPHLDLLK